MSCVSFVSRLATASVLAAVLFSRSAQAVDRLVVATTQVPLSGEASCSLVGTLDRPIVAFSVSARFDPARLQVLGVNPGSALASLDVEYFDGHVDPAGRLSYGMLLDLSPTEPADPRRIPAGSGRELVTLRVAAVGVAEGSTELRLENVAATAMTPPRLNVWTRVDGASVRPALVSGMLELVDRAPQITSLEENRGKSGRRFLVRGIFITGPGLRIEVCGRAASFRVVEDGLVEIIAPPCDVADAWAPVRLVTDHGEDTAIEGFYYEDAQGLFVRGDANDDGGLDLSDGVSIFGDLFIGSPALAPCRDALDANDSGSTDISDGIYVLNFLFQGGPPPPEPWPELGVDPTPDSLPGCD